MAKAPTNQAAAAAGDSADAEVIKATQAQPDPTQAGLGLSGQPSSSGSSSGSLSSATAATGQARPTVVHTMISTIESLPADAEQAMQRLRADAAVMHTLISNTGHYASLPIVEIERLIANIATFVGVVRAKL